MTLTGYMIWFILMAVAITTILVVGTLAAADLLHRPERHGSQATATGTVSLEVRGDETDSHEDLAA